MLKYVLAPIHKDGWRFIAIFAVVTAVLWWLWSPLGWLRRIGPDRGLMLTPAGHAGLRDALGLDLTEASVAA